MICGIYSIRNKENNCRYIGQSKDVSRRYRTHLHDLKNGTHYNTHLQRSYDKYSKNAFALDILEECSINDLAINEQKWIDKFSKSQIYNQVLDIQFRQGPSNPFFGKKHTTQAKLKMSMWKKTNYIGGDNPNYGKKHQLTSLIKMSEGRSKKLNQYDVLQIVELLKKGYPHQCIADIFSICRTAITRIASGTRWSNVTGGPVIPNKLIEEE